MRKKAQESGRKKGAAEKVGKITWVEKPGKVKRILISFISFATFVATGGVQLGLLTDVAYADEVVGIPEIKPVYTRNNRADFMITRVIPSSSYFEWTYERQNSESDGGRRPIYVNAWYGNLTDYELYSLREGDVDADGKQLIYKGTIDELTYYLFVEGTHIPMWESRMAEGAHLMNNDTDQIDYVVIYDNGDVEHVRANYGRCTKSTPFLDGRAYECVLEDAGNGKVRYQPYTASGQRLEIPEEEDAILSAADETWRAVRGWPGEEIEEVMVEPEIEPIQSETEVAEVEVEVGVEVETEIRTEVEMKTEAAEASKTSEPSEEILVPDVDDGFWNLVTLRNGDGIGGGGEVASEATDGVNDGNVNNNSSGISDSDGDDAGVPILGKETEKKIAAWWQPILYSVMAAVAIFGWWFLFFGKCKTNKKGEEKSK